VISPSYVFTKGGSLGENIKLGVNPPPGPPFLKEKGGAPKILVKPWFPNFAQKLSPAFKWGQLKGRHKVMGQNLDGSK